jgi:N-acetylneuraminic acid mutarotase
MKERYISRSALVIPRVLIGLLIVVAGIWLALACLGVFPTLAQSIAQAQPKNKIITNSKDPLVPNGFDCIDDTWSATTAVNAPDARWYHTAVWTGSEMIVWGGFNVAGVDFNTGGRYNPASNTWTAMSTLNAPTARGSHTAVWTGSEMIVWGGYNYPLGDLNTGARYNPITDSWTPISTVNAPAARESPSAVWTGSEMIVWGGRNCRVWMNSGGRYNPATDSWTGTYPWYTPEARWDHSAFWTGSEMIVWGGTNQTIYLNTWGHIQPRDRSLDAYGPRQRAAWSSRSQRRMDRQSNDCLGRRGFDL